MKIFGIRRFFGGELGGELVPIDWIRADEVDTGPDKEPGQRDHATLRGRFFFAS